MKKRVVLLFYFFIMNLLFLHFVIAGSCECDSCFDCTLKLLSCQEVKLTRNITFDPKDLSVKEMRSPVYNFFSGTSPACITIGKNKIFDCQNYTIRGKVKKDSFLFIRGGYGMGETGIELSSISARATVKNCFISDFVKGIHDKGIGNEIIYNNIEGNTVGILNDAWKSNYSFNNIHLNSRGISSYGPSYFSFNNISHNFVYGVEFYGGYFGQNNICFNGIVDYSNMYSYAKSEVFDVIFIYLKSKSKRVGGGKWEKNNTCESNSLNSNEICLPCESKISCFCDSCVSCSEKLNNPICSDVALLNDINTDDVRPFEEPFYSHFRTRACINIGLNNVIFDLGGHKITKSDDYTRNGIYLFYKSNGITIKNGEISGFSGGEFDSAILFMNEPRKDIVIENITLRDNRFGIRIEKSNNITISDIYAENNSVSIMLKDIYYRYRVPSIRYLDEGNHIQNIVIRGVKTGFDPHSGIILRNVSDSYFDNIIIENNLNRDNYEIFGINADDVKMSVFRGINISGCSKSGFVLTKGINNMIRESVFEKNGEEGLYVFSNSGGTTLYDIRACENNQKNIRSKKDISFYSRDRLLSNENNPRGFGYIYCGSADGVFCDYDCSGTRRTRNYQTVSGRIISEFSKSSFSVPVKALILVILVIVLVFLILKIMKKEKLGRVNYLRKSR